MPVRGSRKMIEGLRRAGGNPRHTEITGHGQDLWTVAYRDVEVPRWLLVQRRTQNYVPGRHCPKPPSRTQQSTKPMSLQATDTIEPSAHNLSVLFSH